MALQWQSALMMLLPLACYLGLLAWWHGGRHPVVVSGPKDFALLAFGLAGVIIFGPLGTVVAGMLSGRPRQFVWLGLASWLSLVVLFLSRRARTRLVVYHIDPLATERAVEDALDDRTGRYIRTREGFEDRSRAQGVRIDASPRWWTATLDVYGDDPEPLTRHLERRLRKRLRTTACPSSQVSWVFLASSSLTLLIPLLTWLAAQPQARAALRGIFHRIPGG